MNALNLIGDAGSPCRAPRPRGAFGEYPIGVFVITLQPLSMSRSSDNTPSGTPYDLIAMFNAVCSTLS